MVPIPVPYLQGRLCGPVCGMVAAFSSSFVLAAHCVEARKAAPPWLQNSRNPYTEGTL